MKLQKFNSINVIPFIDVLLVLLAIVLLTSTFIARGDIPVSLAKAASAKKSEIKKEFIITIKEDNSLYLNKSHISFENLSLEVNKINKDSHIFIKSDKKANFESFVTVLDLLKSNDFSNISIITKKN
ncbi:Biopolymer transport protein ExbD/TolR [Arcobacter nitrofigilis DSM 7299]|uniref:Biopolymer transport protein ExbD n=1 Tax=Arcobacter nitrofigilis (strain ATCC 33309 / DSM 7299 / CCUG 15893 / LMG 7604 / NCTC 12251 / CI) TaxID=572480 RepID=D5V1S5_ARCNC|nr:TonB system transport protein ExbD [Arcobacter nitrofigilis]ADG93509.1 Biopolymer transport protein ExbD/TolR [Arcobacter nitrofigilis DSM 7299]